MSDTDATRTRRDGAMTHEDRAWHHEMETLEGIHEHAERIAKLEELVLDLMSCPSHLDDCKRCKHAIVTPKSVTGNWDDYECGLAKRADELGVVE